MNIPIGLAAIALTARFVPESRARRPRRPDPVGQALIVVMLGSLTYAIIEGPRFFRSAPFAGAVLTAISATAAVGGFLFLATLYLQDVRALSALSAGLHLLPMATMMALGAVVSSRIPASGRWARRPAPRPCSIRAASLRAATAAARRSSAGPLGR